MAAKSKKLTIALIQDQFPDKNHLGGISTFGWFFANALVNNGHKVHVICESLQNDHEPDQQLNNNLTIHRIPSTRTLESKKKTKIQEILPGKEKFFAYNAYLKLKQLIASGISIDIIHCSDYKAPAYYFLKKNDVPIPLVLMCHTPAFLADHMNDEENLFTDLSYNRKLHKMERFCLETSPFCISPSFRMAQLLSSHADRMLDDFSIIPYPYPIHQELNTIPEQVNCNLPYILFTGRIEKRKGISTLIKAWSKSQYKNEYDLILAGRKTNHQEYFESQIDEVGLDRTRIHFLGDMNRKQLAWLYRNTTLVVLPSEPFDNYPYTCIEAMAFGAPVLASDSGGMAEMIDHEKNGWLFRVSDADNLASTLDMILGLPIKKKFNISQKAQDFVKRNLDTNRIVQMHINHYIRLIERYKT